MSASQLTEYNSCFCGCVCWPPRRSSWSRNRICPHVKSQERLWVRPLISCQKLFPVSHSFAEQTQKTGWFGEGFGSQLHSAPSVQAGTESLSVPFTTSTPRPKSTHTPKDSSLVGNQGNTGNKRLCEKDGSCATRSIRIWTVTHFVIFAPVQILMDPSVCNTLWHLTTRCHIWETDYQQPAVESLTDCN